MLFHNWIKYYGAMWKLVSDQEGGVKTDETAYMLDRWSIRLVLRGSEDKPGAEVAERHMSEYQRKRFWTCKGEEFQKIVDRKAVTVIAPSRATEIRKRLAHRVLGSRYVNACEESQ